MIIINSQVVLGLTKKLKGIKPMSNYIVDRLEELKGGAKDDE